MQQIIRSRHYSQHNFRQRTTQADLDEIEDWTDRAARRMYEGAGLGAIADTAGARTRAAQNFKVR